MTVGNIYSLIDGFAPFSLAEEWDNSGILVGDEKSPAEKILVALDCTMEVALEAVDKGVDLIVTHHPLIFDPLYNLSFESIPSVLISNKISLVSAHTNLDKAAVSLNMAKELGLQSPSCDGFVVVGETKEMTAEELAEKCQNVFSAEKIRYVKGDRSIKKVALCSGSGGSELMNAIKMGADAFVTGDIKHDVFLEAKRLDITLVDAGHYETEKIYMPHLAAFLASSGAAVEMSSAEERPYRVF